MVGIAIAVIYRHEIHPTSIRNAIAGNPLAPIVFIALQVAASLLFVPRAVLGIASGMLFGLFWGCVWAIVGATLGASAGFAMVRIMGFAGTLDTQPSVGGIVAKAEQGGWRAVAVVRLVPIPHSVVNTILALTNLSWKNYLMGSFAGMIPMTFAQVAIGASGGEIIDAHGKWMWACLLLAFGLAGSLALRRTANKLN
jgi:uncharacterized membrane protein YdjX (TVP38/TMEM64 family)